MEKSIPKKFQKAIACIIAVLMVITSMPLNAIIASAATANEIYDGLDAEFKSHQVGFFFSDASTDPKYDKISGTNKLSGSGATWDSAEGGFKFNGDNADHLYIKASDILGNVTSETGFTIHFEAKSLSYDWQRYFDFMCSEPLGTGDTYYLCATPNGGGKVCVKHSNGASGYDEMEQIGGMNTSDGQWHTYTIAVSNSTVEVWVDGKAYASKQDGLIDSAWFNQMRDNGYIRFGISAFSADPAYDGWMKNVHVYDVAYTEPAYLFAYFTGDDDQADAVNQRIRFALSKDGVNFTSINGNAPILKNDQVSGTITWNNKTGMAHTKGVRDPFIIKKVNEAGYFVVATDLRVGKNGGSYNNSKIVVWDINDLSKADKAIPWVVETSGMFGSSYYSGSTINKDYIAWAPEVTYDYQNNIYMMYWSGPLYSSSTILCAYTHDFKTFYQDPQATKTIDGNTVKPKTLFSESGQNTIDADIVFDGSNYYMVYKRESEKQLYFVKAATIEGLSSQTGTRFYDSRFTGANGNNEGLEGPELYKNAAGKWTLIADNYTANTGAGSKGIFYMYQVDSLDEFMTGADCSSKSVTTNISDCSPRHGSVTTISSGVFASLNKEYGGVSDAKGALVARYFTSSDTTADTSGNGYTMSFPNGGVRYVSEFNGVKNCVHFDASTSNKSGTNPIYAKVSTAGMMADYNFNYYDGLTMTWKAYDEDNDSNGGGYTGFFTLTETENATPGGMTEDTTNYNHYDTAYAFLLDGMCSGVSSGTPGSADNGTTVYDSNKLCNQWVDYKLVIAGKGYKVYRNGTLVREMSVPIITQQWYLDLFTKGTLLLGTTLFANDLNYKGYMADFRIYATGNQDSVKALEEEVANQDLLAENVAIKQYCKDNINKLSVQSASKAIAFNGGGGNIVTDHVLYSANDSTSASGVTGVISGDTKLTVNTYPASSRVVFLNDNTQFYPELPVIVNISGSPATNSTMYWGVNYIALDSANNWALNKDWLSCTGVHNATDSSDNGTKKTNGYDYGFYKISYQTSGNSQDIDVYCKNGRTEGVLKSGAAIEGNGPLNTRNVIRYNYNSSTFSFGDTYYLELSNPTFKMSADGGSKWGTWGFYKAGEWNNLKNWNGIKFGNGNAKTYVLNYKPLINVISEINGSSANSYKNISANEWIYEEVSLAKYYASVKKVIDYNLNGYDYSTDAGLQASANAIKDAVVSYTLPTKKKINVDFTFANGKVETKTINAGDTLSSIIPANTSAQYNNNKLSHMTYTWSEGCEASHMPTEDEAYFEVFATNECSFDQNTTTAPTCEDAGLATFTCPVCKGSYTDSVPALGHNWSTTITSNNNGTHRQICQNDNSHILDTPCNMVVKSETDTQTVMACNTCGYEVTTVKLNRDAYNNAVDAARAVILNETAKYSADSLKELQAVLNKAATDSLSVKTQAELDEITATIITANKTTANGGVLVANTFRITYGNLFDYNEFMNSDSKNISNPDWGTIDFDIANQVFTVIGNGTYDDVYSAYNSAGTYKLDVSDSTSYTFEYTAKGTVKNQAFVFFYDENGTPINVGENYKYLYNGTEMTAAADQYFVCRYETPDGGTTKLTFTPPAGTVRVDFRFGVTLGSESCDFKKIAFYETSKANNFIVADDVVYGSSFDEIAISTPDVDGMHFGGWFVDKECTTSVSTIGTITQNINLYAKLDPYVVKEEVGCTLTNNGYTVYVCSDENCSSTGEYKAFDEKLLDGTTNGYWDAYNELVALVAQEEGNGYATYSKDSIDAIKLAYTTLHETACGYYKQSEVDEAAEQMKAIKNQLRVTITFVDKDGVSTSNDYEVGASVTAPGLPATEYIKNSNGTHNVVTYAWNKTPSPTATANATYTVTPSTEENVACDYTTRSVEATCIVAGSTEYTCTKCGYTYTDTFTTNPNNHKNKETVPAKAPTCTQDGWDAYEHCNDCNKDINKVTRPATGHKFTTYEVTKAATCTETGTKVATCDNHCGETDTQTIPALGHSYTSVVTAPTCTAQGYTTYTCSRCNDTYVDDYVPANGHTEGTPVEENRVEPTCTVDGSYDSVVYCTVCKAELSRETKTIEKLGHSFTKYVQTVAPTCTTVGTEMATCDRCDVTDTRDVAIDESAHKWGDWVDDKNGSTHTRVCSYNAAHTEQQDHNMTGNTCDDCGYVAKVMITFKNVDGTVISSVEYAVGTAVTIPDLPATEKNDNGDGTHTVVTYAWDDEPQTTAQTEATYTVTSLSNKVDCSFELTQPDIEDGDKTKDKFTCSVCGGVMYKEVADKTALNAAIVALQNDLDLPEAEYKYDAARVEAAQALINEANAIDRYADQSVVNAKAEAIATAKTELNAEENLAKYTITVEVVNSENAEDKEVSKYGIVLENQPYGKTFEHSFVFDKIDDGTSMTGLPKYAVYKWMVGDVKLNTTDTSISGVVKGNATYICYVLNFKATNETQNTTRVRYLDKSGKTLKIDYATVDTTYTANYSEVPKIPYYKFTKWERVYGEDNPVGTREVVYQARYEYDEVEANNCTIVGLGGVKVNGAERCSAIYDSKVVLTGATKYAFCDSTGKIISYINNDYIYTPHINNETVYITAVVDEVTKATTAITGNFVQKNVGTLNDGRTYHNLYVNAQFYLPEDATAVEAGLVLSKSKSSEEDLQIGKQNVTKLVSTSQSSNHEYSMAMSFANDGTVHARSYLIYVDKSGTTHTVYSAVKTIEYKA